MSRGPGIWQRRILAILEVKPVFYLRHVLPDRPTRAPQVALLRAAHRLEAQGRVLLVTWVRRPREQGAVMVARPRSNVDEARSHHNPSGRRIHREILSVIEDSILPLDNT